LIVAVYSGPRRGVGKSLIAAYLTLVLGQYTKVALLDFSESGASRVLAGPRAQSLECVLDELCEGFSPHVLELRIELRGATSRITVLSGNTYCLSYLLEDSNLFKSLMKVLRSFIVVCDLPSTSSRFSEDVCAEFVRLCDLVLLIVDCGRCCVDDVRQLLSGFEEFRGGLVVVLNKFDATSPSSWLLWDLTEFMIEASGMCSSCSVAIPYDEVLDLWFRTGVHSVLSRLRKALCGLRCLVSVVTSHLSGVLRGVCGVCL